MSMRIKLARYLLRIGEFIQTLPVAVMRPDDLVEFSRQSYAKPGDVESWAVDSLVDSGLSKDEQDLLKEIPTASGDLLLLGVGGGREAITLAKMGFRVTGVDYVPEMVKRARQNATQRGVTIDVMVQEMSRLDVPPGAYDVVWLSRAMYSCVPTRKRRIQMVQRIASALKPGGYFLCQFHWLPNWKTARLGELLRRLVVAFSLGNFGYEEGDMFWLKVEFIHGFFSEDAIRSELEEGGLAVMGINTNSTTRGNAVCKKNK